PVFVIPKRSGEGFCLLHNLRTVNKKNSTHGSGTNLLTLLSQQINLIAQTVSNAPSFIVHINEIFNSDGIGIDPNQGKPFAYVNWETYWCPSVNPSKSYCTYPGYGFCGYWSCETIVTSNQWAPEKRDSFLDVSFWPKDCKRPIFAKSGMIAVKGSCSHLNVTVLQPQDTSWLLGQKWSVFLHSWDVDPNMIVQIIRTSPPHHTALRPNRVVAQQYNHINSSPTPSFSSVTPAFHSALELTSHALFHRMLNAAFLLLNATKPDFTHSCWLWYDANPPFYEGVDLNAMFSYIEVKKRSLAVRDFSWVKLFKYKQFIIRVNDEFVVHFRFYKTLQVLSLLLYLWTFCQQKDIVLSTGILL
uniref:Uncharacterized protein n=1 Tax=Cyanistes caeruleus TaxID=156563 RepID=A0A8C0TYJ1_CYACU